MTRKRSNGTILLYVQCETFEDKARYFTYVYYTPNIFVHNDNDELWQAFKRLK
jgi:hypothetical protein